MGRIGKTLAILLTLTIVLSSLTLLAVKPANAQSTPKPSPPEYTLTFIPASETITHTDPYNGSQTVEIVDKSTIEVKIKNQPFDKSLNGVNYYLFYSINAKGHYSTNEYWGSDARYFYGLGNFSKEHGPPQNSLEATDSDFTVVSISIGGDFPSNAKIDVYVSAALMYDGELYVYDYIGDPYPRTIPGVVLGEVSNPSIQTLNLADGSVSSSTPNPSPTVPELPFVTTLSLLVVIPLITILVRKRICLKAYN